MNIQNTLKTALNALITNKLRSLLTMLGVIIGVASVILLTAIGNGLQVYISDQFESLGANTVTVLPGDSYDKNETFSQAAFSAYLTNKLRIEHVREISRLKSFVSEVIPEYENTAEIVNGKIKKSVGVQASSPDYQVVRAIALNQGRFFSESEAQSGKAVLVLGSSIAADLFGDKNPVGRKVLVNNQTFKIVGVAEEKGGGISGLSVDSQIFIPIETAFKLYNTSSVTSITAKIRSQDRVAAAEVAIENALLRRLKAEDFSVVDLKQILNSVNQILGVLTLGLGGIAAISLVVGGIGIMNIMLVSVTERTREIGLRKALGATPTMILQQFLIEASFLSVLGGMIGVAIAFLLTLAIKQFFPAVVTIEAVVLAFGISALIGIIFGVYPARQASLLSPIEALRSE